MSLKQIRDRYMWGFWYGIIALILYCLQLFGLEYLQDKLSTNLTNWGIPVGERFVIYFLFLLFPNTVIAKSLVTFAMSHQKETVKMMSKFLKMSIKEDMLHWFYMMKLIIGIMIGKTSFCIWVNPIQYMKMHIAASVLARRYYYSFYKAPDKIWQILRNYGGTNYRDEIKEINLVYGERYVSKEDATMFAYNDFASINNLRLFYVKPQEIKNVADFSSFDVAEKFINIKILDSDDEAANQRFINFKLDPSKPVENLKELNKIKFRTHVDIANKTRDSSNKIIPNLDWVQKALEQLQGNVIP